jgi:hypothetical protein
MQMGLSEFPCVRLIEIKVASCDDEWADDGVSFSLKLRYVMPLNLAWFNEGQLPHRCLLVKFW